MIKKNDLKLAGTILTLAFLLIISNNIYKNIKTKNNQQVIVSVNGEKRNSFSLEKDTIYRISTKEGYNQIEIKNKIVRMIDADCKDKLCIHQGKIEKDSESIVCLPHKLIVSIKSEDKSDIDIIR